ncbi:hypothetical protein F5B22DRAFT_139605 [Xylaria bambusicola]|uniref:uncharacterized protein n=1 Tax=Xylaria bambusicola TaxID=326684 RepID=UPI0020084A3C|nr:uncharacterized protein F5B22DRAFT_139605 [Xylaria bambusicola]KAI0516972.1 hypothetical protein F5B22DRAFT_139605 [Xylaria bambusicola]
MLRQLRAWYRNPSRSLTSIMSSLMRSPKPQQRLSWQRHFFSQPRIPRHNPRTNQHRYHGSKPKQLHARVFSTYCTIYVSIMALVIDDRLDWRQRRGIGIHVIQDVIGEEDPEEMRRKFYELGLTVFHSFVKSDISEYLDIGFGNNSAASAKLYSAPDPEVEGGTFLLYLVALDSSSEHTHIVESGNRVTDIAEDLIPNVEKVASVLAESGRVRGAMVLLEEDGSWKSIYWDGKRWINVVFLEWQTPESMAFIWE